jgi:DNA-binding PucR family transcriptional regulator
MSGSQTEWPRPSERASALIRGFAQATLAQPDEIFSVVDDAVIEAIPDRLRAEPGIVQVMREANHANLTHWISATAARPGARVPPNVGPEMLELTRDIVRRGFDETSLNAYRVGQNAALQFLTDRIFEATDDIDLIRELLEVASRSVFAFVNDTIVGLETAISRERDLLERGTHAERMATVNLLLEGAPIKPQTASASIGYELAGRHRAAVLWTEDYEDAAGLEPTAEALARAAGAVRAFTVAAGARSLWVWFEPTDGEAGSPATDQLAPRVRVAIGSDERGLAGFRRSHFNALATQRLMGRAGTGLRIAAYPQIELVAIAAADDDAAADFARRTLGKLATADPILRETLLAYIRADLNAAAAARRLFAHRNTVINRLDRARQLLPGPLEGRVLEVGIALEIARWLGVPAGESAG